MNLITEQSRRAGRRRLVLALVVAGVVPAALLGWVATSSAHTAERGDPPATTAPPPPALRTATPLLSARRLPGTVTGQLATKDLVPGLQQLADSLPAPTCLTVQIDGVPVFDARGDQPVMPASNMKLITAAVALSTLGPDYRYTTTVERGPDGTLYLVGGGDPVLESQAYLDAATAAAKRGAAGQFLEGPSPVRTPVEQLADQVAAAVKNAPAIVADESRYDTERLVPSWPPNTVKDLDASPLGAIMIDDSFSSFAPFTVASDPAAQSASRFQQLLAERGVTIGAARVGTAPAGLPAVATVQSPPLRDILSELLVTSDNNTAELLVKEIGHQAGGAGTRAAGLKVVGDTLTAWGVPTAGLQLIDGSGLDRGDRLTCHVLLAVLDRMGTTGDLAAALPVAAQSGTLAPYFRGSPVAGKLRAKTGTLTGAKALTGFVPAADGHTVTFAFVYNGPNARERANDIWGQFADTLATYPYHPDLGAFSPAPAVHG